MDIRIATTFEDGKVELLKVRTCSDCPNAIDQFHSEKTHSPGQIESRYCELFDLNMPAFSHVLPVACRLPSLLEISRHLLETGSCPLRGLFHE